MSQVPLIFASHNKNKTAEIKALLPQYSVQSLAELGFHEEIEETGSTLQENAALKARRIFEEYGHPVFADDTGLIVPAINGEPGVFSARYAGEPASAERNMAKLLTNLSGVENRQAYFETVICFIGPSGKEFFFSGRVDGTILREPKGTEGFGYDPIFAPEGATLSFAEMSAKEKNQISHRGRALAKFIQFLKQEEKN